MRAARPVAVRELLDRLSADGRRNALTHSSYADSPDSSYERLEFLGDAVLDLAIASELFAQHPELAEGDLSKLRSAVVSRRDCAVVARRAGLADAMVEVAAHYGDDAVALARELVTREKVLAALAEAVIGQAFLELGYDQVAPHVVEAFAERVAHAEEHRTDHKSELQERAQRVGETVVYALLETGGPDHDRRFVMQARVGEGGPTARGEGRTKKAAEQVAARRLLELLEGS